MILDKKNQSVFQNLLLLLAFIQFANSEPKKSKKYNLTHFISGGTPDDNHDLGRFIVSIQLKTLQETTFGRHHFCGGSIISSKKILTAAHCLYKRRRTLYKPKELVAVVGLRHRFTRTKDTQVKDIAVVKSHKAFRPKTLYADVGFLILKEDIVLNPLVAVIELTNRPVVINQNCTISGWGKLFEKGPVSDRLMFADIEIFKRQHCQRKYRSSFTRGMICAGYPKNWKRDSCEGDSGGPLICEERVVGIVSWGVGCGRNNLPGVYTDVYYYKEWISDGLWLRGNFCLICCVYTFVVLIEKVKQVTYISTKQCVSL